MKKEFSEGNKFIAEFMGFEKVRVGYFDDSSETKWQRDNRAWLDKNEIESVGNYIVNIKKNKCIEWNEVAYHKSFDWLMPVVDKIRDNNCLVSIRFNRQMKTTNTVIACFENKWVKDVEVSGIGIESTYKAVIEFIKWYNQNKKPNYEILSTDKESKEVIVAKLNRGVIFNAIITIGDTKYYLEKDRKKTATYLLEKDWLKKYKNTKK